MIDRSGAPAIAALLACPARKLCPAYRHKTNRSLRQGQYRFPVKGTVCGLPPPLSLMASAPVEFTSADHVTVQDCPAARLAGHGHLFVCEKAPETEILLVFNGVFPRVRKRCRPEWVAKAFL